MRSSAMIKNDDLVTCLNLQAAILEGKYKFCVVLLLVFQELNSSIRERDISAS